MKKRLDLFLVLELTRAIVDLLDVPLSGSEAGHVLVGKVLVGELVAIRTLIFQLGEEEPFPASVRRRWLHAVAGNVCRNIL